MLQSNSFNLAKRIEQLYTKKLPFVTYHKPKDNFIRCISQTDNSLTILTNFTEKGFVFTPFSIKNGSILFSKKNTISKKFSLSEADIIPKKQDFTIKKEVENKNLHKKLVKKGINFIKKGIVDKVVLSRKEILEITNFDFITTFLQLVKKYPNAFSYLWYHPKVGMWLGATPEILLQVKKNRFKIMSLAGTQAHNGTKNVVWKEKEIQEQKIVTDYIVSCCVEKNIICKISDAYTVRAGNILHIRTDIQGNISNSNTIDTLIKVLHPTPAVCGMPKDKAREFIVKNEGYDREFYTGFLGELNLDYATKRQQRNIENHSYKRTNIETNLFVNLRCMQVKKNTIELYLGGGITKDSIPQDEYTETVLKSKIIKNILL